MKEFAGKVFIVVSTQTQHFHSYEGARLFCRLPSYFQNNRVTTGFDAARASAVFFKLPCLKLFDHDKMNAFSGRARRLQYSPVKVYVEGMNGGFESWRDGPGDRASRSDGKTETQIQAQ